jgi:hypothetical protein
MTQTEQRFTDKLARSVRLALCDDTRGSITVTCYDLEDMLSCRAIFAPIVGPRLMDRVEFRYRDFYKPPRSDLPWKRR